MVYHGTPWYTKVYHGAPWYTTVRTTTMCYDTVVYHSLYTMLTTHSMFAGDLHTHTAVAGLALHLLLSTDPTAWHTDRQTEMGRHLAVKEQTYRRCRMPYIGLCIQQSCGGNSHWLEDTKNRNRQKYFCWVGMLFQTDIPVLFTYQLCLWMSVFN